MSIRIQLWRNERQVGRDRSANDPDPSTGISEQADRIVDGLLTEVHQGRHGYGTFRVEAEHVDDRSVFLGSYHTSKFTFPKQDQSRDVHCTH